MLSTYFEIEGEVQELPGERDQNFHVSSQDGQEWVLKIAHPDADQGELEVQNLAMQSVAEQIGSRACPSPKASKSGSHLVEHPFDGLSYLLRLVPFLPGRPLAKVTPHHDFLIREVGKTIGRLTRSLASFADSRADRLFRWDLARAETVVETCWGDLSESQRSALQPMLDRYRSIVSPVSELLPTSVIHGDANDYNLIVDINDDRQLVEVAIIDFGDLVESHTINEIAIAAAYVAMHHQDPLKPICELVAGYHFESPISELELSVLFPLVGMRLAVSATLAQLQSKKSDDPYLTISQSGAWQSIERLTEIHPEYAEARIRHACGLSPVQNVSKVTDWINHHAHECAQVTEFNLRKEPFAPIDLSMDTRQFTPSMLTGAGAKAWTEAIESHCANWRANVAVGGYNEARLCYQGKQFETSDHDPSSRRTIHLGVDLFAAAGTSVFAALDGTVVGCCDNDLPFDYGPTLILQHEPVEGTRFFTLYGHLSRESLEQWKAGDRVEAGQSIGWFGDIDVNGGWPPHLHFQVMCSRLGNEGDFPGVGSPDLTEFWLQICPDPNALLGIVDEPNESGSASHIRANMIERRKRLLSPSLSLSYQQPLHIVRGMGQYLFDSAGRSYLDAVNNVCHVGHCHPRVVDAATQQMATLNTNTRYLHGAILDYTERLLETLPEPLEVCFLVNSGSEANDLAMRLARAATQADEWIVVDVAYHGNLQSLIEISPYKHNAKGGVGAPGNVHALDLPDGFRGRFRGTLDEVGSKYASRIKSLLDELIGQGRRPAAFIAESILSCGGQIVLPDGYLREVYQHVRDAGGVCIADEVQVGFGRVGSHFWGFELQGVVPDIVTMGKPIGNGHPLGAVVTTRRIAEAFANGMEYFNTFGGNPVSASVGLAVLDVIKDQELQNHALTVGSHLKQLLTEVASRHDSIGEVRGEGLFLGVELVDHSDSRNPDANTASYCAQQMLRTGILMSTDGPDYNVLKIKPPLVFDMGDAARLAEALDEALTHQVRYPKQTDIL